MLDLDVRTRIERGGRSVLPANDERGSTVLAVDFKDLAVSWGFALMVALHHQPIARSRPKLAGAFSVMDGLLLAVGSTVMAQGWESERPRPLRRLLPFASAEFIAS